MNHFRTLTVALGLLALSSTQVIAQPAPAAAVKVALTRPAGSADFPAALQVAGQTLQLNGKGTRYRTVLKVYDIGLYAGAKVGSLEQLLALPGTKRFQLVTLRDLSGDSLGLAMVRGMQDNMPAAERSKLLAYMDRLSRIFASEPEVRVGSVLLVEHTPGKGTTLWLNGVQKGEVVPDPEYFSSVARIWLGPRPVDPMLKDALLGQPVRRPESGI